MLIERKLIQPKNKENSKSSLDDPNTLKCLALIKIRYADKTSNAKHPQNYIKSLPNSLTRKS